MTIIFITRLNSSFGSSRYNFYFNNAIIVDYQTQTVFITTINHNNYGNITYKDDRYNSTARTGIWYHVE